MDKEDFIQLVAEMRRMQRDYFRTRLDSDKRAAMRLEKDVDKWIARHNEELGKPGTQGSLLG